MKTIGIQWSSLSEIEQLSESIWRNVLLGASEKGLDLPESVLQAWSSTSAPTLEAKSVGLAGGEATKNG